MKQYARTAQLNFTGHPLPHRKFDEMGKDFSPEGDFSHCHGCKKRVPTQNLISEETPSGLASYCPNCRKHSTASKTAQKPHEKYLRDNTLGPKADDTAPIAEKKLPHREGYEQTVTEDQMNLTDSGKEAQIIEKVLESANSPYVTHRSDAAQLTIPPINALVEKIRQKRLADDWKPQTDPHWSHTFNENNKKAHCRNGTKMLHNMISLF